MTNIPKKYAVNGIAASYTSGDTLSLSATSFLFSQDNIGLLLGGTGQTYSLTVHGEIRGSSSDGADGLWLKQGNIADIAVGPKASIRGATGMDLDGKINLSIAGSVIGADGYGIEIANGTVGAITNTGRIYGSSGGISWTGSGTGMHRLENFGTISGPISVLAASGSASVEVIKNHGVINGSLSLGGGADVVDNQNGIISGSISLGDGQNQFFGGRGGERVLGGSDYDFLSGGGGKDTLVGGAGDDDYYVDNAGDKIVEAAGDTGDTVVTTVSYSLAANAEIEQLFAQEVASTARLDLWLNAIGATEARGNAGRNIITSIDSDGAVDVLKGLGGDDTYMLGDLIDKVIDSGGNDTILTSIDLSLASYTGVDNITLTDSFDVGATGNGLANVLTGNKGKNQLDGASGNDKLIGGMGADKLFGGAGRDTFDFNSVGESGLNAGRDTIFDFRSGYDRIDLNTIDAKAGGANDAFHLLARSTPTSAVDAGGIGHYWVDKAGTNDDLTVLRLNTDSDAAIEMSIALKGLLTLKAADFIL